MKTVLNVVCLTPNIQHQIEIIHHDVCDMQYVIEENGDHDNVKCSLLYGNEHV